jgi:dTDP-4-amino-4,6-dideoxygalactose transaminase
MPYSVIRNFEESIAAWTGARYAVAVESCTAAIFLCCVYRHVKTVKIPKQTYPSVPCSIIHAGGRVKFTDEIWDGIYELKPYKIYDAALRFRPEMYEGGFVCLSFHLKKHLPIGRGGMILTDNPRAYEWFKRARFDGRGECPLSSDKFTMLGWNMYLQPEQAARGLQLFQVYKSKNKFDDLPFSEQGYPDLSKFPVYQ